MIQDLDLSMKIFYKKGEIYLDNVFKSEGYKTAKAIIEGKKNAVLTVKPKYDTYTQDTVVKNLTELRTVFKYCDRMRYDIIEISPIAR